MGESRGESGEVRDNKLKGSLMVIVSRDLESAFVIAIVKTKCTWRVNYVRYANDAVSLRLDSKFRILLSYCRLLFEHLCLLVCRDQLYI